MFPKNMVILARNQQSRIPETSPAPNNQTPSARHYVSYEDGMNYTSQGFADFIHTCFFAGVYENLLKGVE